MISLCNYRLESRGGLFFVIALESVTCPLCAAVLLEIGRRARGYISSEGDRESVQIRRMKCSVCLRIHHELPDFLLPYKRHCAQTVESIVNGETEDVPCTPCCAHKLRTWWLLVSSYFAAILCTLIESVGAIFSEGHPFKETIRAVVNSNN